MTTSAASEGLLGALAALERALARTGEPHMLIGGLAVIARGVPRDTHDIDATVWASDLDLDALLRCLADEGIRGRIADVREFAQRTQVLLLVHEPTRTPMEVSLAWLPFERQALERAETLVLGGVELPVALAEDLVVYKTVAWRDRDRADVERLLRLHGGRMDLARVRSLVLAFSEALEEPERPEEFERLAQRALEGD